MNDTFAEIANFGEELPDDIYALIDEGATLMARTPSEPYLTVMKDGSIAVYRGGKVCRWYAVTPPPPPGPVVRLKMRGEKIPIGMFGGPTMQRLAEAEDYERDHPIVVRKE